LGVVVQGALWQIAELMTSAPELEVPPQLEAYELELRGVRFVLFEWNAQLSYPAKLKVQLSKAEREVLGELLAGKATHEIAVQRQVAGRTVANQIAAIFRKFGVHSRSELAAHFVNISGLLEDGVGAQGAEEGVL
jgi:DNA-binding CsgD family transcriptional regulator